MSQRATLSFPLSMKYDLQAFAARFGQRRGAAIIRIAVRRLVDKPGRLTPAVAGASGVGVVAQVSVVLGEDLDRGLDLIDQRHGTSRAVLARIACDRFLAWIAHRGLHAATVDLAAEVNAEVYRGAANRELLIRRRERAEARKGPVPWSTESQKRRANRGDAR